MVDADGDATRKSSDTFVFWWVQDLVKSTGREARQRSVAVGAKSKGGKTSPMFVCRVRSSLCVRSVDIPLPLLAEELRQTLFVSGGCRVW